MLARGRCVATLWRDCALINRKISRTFLDESAAVIKQPDGELHRISSGYLRLGRDHLHPRRFSGRACGGLRYVLWKRVGSRSSQSSSRQCHTISSGCSGQCIAETIEPRPSRQVDPAIPRDWRGRHFVVLIQSHAIDSREAVGRRQEHVPSPGRADVEFAARYQRAASHDCAEQFVRPANLLARCFVVAVHLRPIVHAIESLAQQHRHGSPIHNPLLLPDRRCGSDVSGTDSLEGRH